MEKFTIIALITIVALIVYQAQTMTVGFNRYKHKVKPPETNGPEPFLRAFRAHQNMLEALIIFLPAFWIFAALGNIQAATIIGSIWVFGRILYAVGYVLESKKRFPGFVTAMSCTFTLIIWSLIILVQRLFV
jgi:glutathione S-transferase